MTGAQCLADMLKGYGVTHVFHVPAVLRSTYAEMERRETGIKRLHVHGEKAAAYMADGYARASGKPGICMAQVIGALNLAAGLRDAWLAHSPVIAMTGGREPKTKFRQVYQEVDDVPAFEPVTKFNATVDDVARFPDMVRQAFRVATSGTPGPGAPAIPRQRGTDRRRRGGDGAAGRAAIRARAGVPAAARRGERARGAQMPRRVGAAGDRRRRRRARLGRPGRTRRARRGSANSGRDFAQRQGFDFRQPSAVGRRRRHLFARERKPRRQRRRPRLLHRHRDRRHDHAFLGGAEDRHADRRDRHQSRSHRPQLSVRSGGEWRRQGRPGGDAENGEPRHRRSAQGVGGGGAENLRRVAEQIQIRARIRRGADPPRAAVPRTDASTCPTTPSWSSTPATPACGWAACSI